jgi:DNA-binding winged helix-turn-helix (wHTH) protein
MTTGRFRFERFVLDSHDRQLTCDDRAVELNTRYLDALALLVREQGKLVSKDRFLDEVWRGVPVTDEALTQCIRTLRRQLGDDATRPRFIETVVKHGYRFIAPVEIIAAAPAVATPVNPSAVEPAQVLPQPYDWAQLLFLSGAGTAGAVLAGLIGGMLYGFSASSQPMVAGMGAVSILLVIICLTVIIAFLGGAGVSFGIAAASLVARGPWTIAGGAAGGLIVGAIVKLVGLDALNLLFGQSPGNITGAPEGAILGAGVGFGAWMANRPGTKPGLRRSVVIGLLSGCAAGVFVFLSGGRLLAGSLFLLSQHVPASRLRLDPIWNALGETTYGPVSRLVTSGLEGALFGSCVVGAIMLARRVKSGAATRH